jgi:hypothetical protein
MHYTDSACFKRSRCEPAEFVEEEGQEEDEG